LFDTPKRSATRASRSSTSAGRRKLVGKLVVILASDYKPTTYDFTALLRNWIGAPRTAESSAGMPPSPLRRGRNLGRLVGRSRKLGAEQKHECNDHLYAHVGRSEEHTSELQ